MKRIILGTLLASCMLFASDTAVEFKSELFDASKIKNEEMKGFLIGMEKSVSKNMSQTVKDYFETKTCKEDFYNTVSIDDIKSFVANGYQFSFLLALNILNSDKQDIDTNTYLQIINNYKFLNCGVGRFYNPIKLLPKHNKAILENLNELSIAEFRDLLSSVKDEAVWNPTDENIKKLKMLQDFMEQKAESFSGQMKKNSMDK
jgi:hypothetical protein